MRMTKDLLAGSLFFALGAGALLVGRHYPIGHATQMGPGYFPLLVGSAIALIGLVIAGRALIDPDSSAPLDRWGLVPLAVILLSVIAFSALIDRFGLIIAIIAVAAISRLAGRRGSVAELAALTAVLVAITAGIFVFGLKVPFQLKPW
jgi:putative tricarboxylic transport membrane protein